MKNKDTGTIVVQKAEVSGIEQVTQSMANVSVSENKPAPSGLSGSFVPGAPSASKPSFVDYISGGCEVNVVVRTLLNLKLPNFFLPQSKISFIIIIVVSTGCH